MVLLGKEAALAMRVSLLKLFPASRLLPFDWEYLDQMVSKSCNEDIR